MTDPHVGVFKVKVRQGNVGVFACDIILYYLAFNPGRIRSDLGSGSPTMLLCLLCLLCQMICEICETRSDLVLNMMSTSCSIRPGL